MDKVTEFRQHARDCRIEAEKATGPDKDQWLKLAEQWERLARQATQFPDIFL